MEKKEKYITLVSSFKKEEKINNKSLYFNDNFPANQMNSQNVQLK